MRFRDGSELHFLGKSSARAQERQLAFDQLEVKLG